MARRQSRVLALRVLFAMEVGRQSMEDALRQEIADEPQAFAEYAREICQGVERQKERIDGLISEFSRGWTLSRLAAVDRCLLRMAAYELIEQPGIPSNAIVSEAVELASIYSTEEAPRFVNGLLARMATELGRPLSERREDAQEASEEEDGQDH
jgi:N utilization substance protein B